MADEQKQPAFPSHKGRIKVVARAICSLPDGDVRQLYASEIAHDGARILTLRPLQVGTTVHITFVPVGFNPLPPIRCRVIEARLHPARQERNGFEVMFVGVDDLTREKLSTALRYLGIEVPERTTVPFAEKRAHLRIRTDLKGTVGLEGRQWSVTVGNLSLGGALVLFDATGAPNALDIGRRFDLCIVCDEIPEVISVQGEVAWLGQDEPAPRSAGVRFVSLDPIVTSRLEGLLLRLVSDFEDELN